MVAKREASLARIKAREILASLRIVHPSEIEVEDIAWVRGVLVREAPLEGAEGRLVRRGSRGIITVKADIREPGKRRFVAAHELGHFELHVDSDQLTLCADEDLLYWYKRIRPEEPEASEFAAELLMAEGLFGPRCRGAQPSLELVEALAEEFRTTLTATALRYMEFCPHRCAIVISEEGKIKWCRGAEHFGYRLPVGAKLHPDSYAIDFFNGKQIPQTMQSVLAGAWISGKKLNPNGIIKEHSRALPRYNAVLTLLWIDKDIDEFSSPDEEEPEYDPDYFTPDGKRWRW